MLEGKGVSGLVASVDNTTLLLHHFVFNGTTGASFVAGISGPPDTGTGVQVPDEKGGLGELREYTREDLLLKLPTTITISSMKWFAIVMNKDVVASVLVPEYVPRIAKTVCSEQTRASQAVDITEALKTTKKQHKKHEESKLKQELGVVYNKLTTLRKQAEKQEEETENSKETKVEVFTNKPKRDTKVELEHVGEALIAQEDTKKNLAEKDSKRNLAKQQGNLNQRSSYNKLFKKDVKHNLAQTHTTHMSRHRRLALLHRILKLP